MKDKEPEAGGQHEHKRGSLKLQGPRGEVMLDHGWGDFPTLWLSHCVHLGTNKYGDLCWFFMTFDLSHN